MILLIGFNYNDIETKCNFLNPRKAIRSRKEPVPLSSQIPRSALRVLRRKRVCLSEVHTCKCRIWLNSPFSSSLFLALISIKGLRNIGVVYIVDVWMRRLCTQNMLPCAPSQRRIFDRDLSFPIFSPVYSSAVYSWSVYFSTVYSPFHDSSSSQSTKDQLSSVNPETEWQNKTRHWCCELETTSVVSDCRWHIFDSPRRETVHVYSDRHRPRHRQAAATCREPLTSTDRSFDWAVGTKNYLPRCQRVQKWTGPRGRCG